LIIFSSKAFKFDSEMISKRLW